MPILQLLFLVGLAVFLVLAIAVARGGVARWQVPALLAATFLAYSLWPVVWMGPFGFWTEHVRNPWGVQIWFDLLCAFGVGWTLLVPRARAAGIGPWPWLALILATGSIGLLAMLARVLHREAALASGGSR